MQLESTLAQFPLSELISMIIGSSVSGVLEVGEVATGQIYFREGRMYHAQTPAYQGEEAIYQLFLFKDAPFRFTAGPTVEQTTIWQDAWDVVEAAERHVVTLEHVKQRFSSLDYVPVLCQSNASNVLIQGDTWYLLAAIDGERSVEMIAHQLGQLPLEVAYSLCNLLDQGVVRMLPPRTSSSSVDQPSARGFFGRIMSAQH